jgi:hypothetical protein
VRFGRWHVGVVSPCLSWGHFWNDGGTYAVGARWKVWAIGPFAIWRGVERGEGPY